MRRTLIVAALGLCSLGAVPASAAPTVTVGTARVEYTGANPVVGACVMAVVASEPLTGGQDTFTGFAAGVAVDTTLGAVDVRCYVRVDHTTVAIVSDGNVVPGVDTTAGQVTYTAGDTQQVELCMVFGLHLGIGPVCRDVTTTPVPTQEMQDLVNGLLFIVHVADPLVCPLLASLAPGVPGLVDIAFEGDLYVLGESVHDCPPYNV